MLRGNFELSLQRLQDEVLILGSMVAHAIIESVEILRRQDLEGARRLIAGDRLINQRRFEIEAQTISLIASQQPVAGDLRLMAAVLEIATELERIGDYAKGIAKISLLIGKEPLLGPLTAIPRMAEKAASMLQRALDAFIRKDANLARSVPAEDDEVDNLYNQVYRELLSYIVANPRSLNQATYLLWVAHNLERAADRVTNICERVVFMVSGEMIEMDAEGIGPEGIN